MSVSNNIKTREVTCPGDQSWVLVAGVNTVRATLFIKNNQASTDAVRISVGHEPAEDAGALVHIANSGFEWYSGTAPLGPVYARSGGNSGCTLTVMEG